MGLVAVMTEAARGDSKDEWTLNLFPTFHMSHTRAGMTASKKAPAGTTVEVADEIILPVDWFGTVVVDLDQPGTTTKPLKMVSVGYVRGRSRNLLSTRKAVKHWSNPLVYYKNMAVLWFPGEESLIF